MLAEEESALAAAHATGAKAQYLSNAVGTAEAVP